MFSLQKEWQIDTATASTAKISPNGEFLAIIRNLTILIYSITDNNDTVDVIPLTEIITTHTAPISDLVWSPDGQCIASASDDYSIVITHCHYGHLHKLRGHTAPVTNLTYNPRGNLLYSSSMDESIKVWDVLNGTLLKTISAHSESVVSISMSPGDPTVLCSGSYDGLIRLFDSQTGHCLKTLTYDKDWKKENDGVIPIVKVEVAYNGKYILVKSLDGVMKIWDCARGDVIRIFDTTCPETIHKPLLKHSTDCRLFYPRDTPREPLVVSGDEDGLVHCWQCNKPGQELQTLQDVGQLHKGSPIMSIDTNSQLNFICVLSMNGTCSIWKWGDK
ncbi:COMPASS component Swd3p [Monosporozyma unispora]|nr:WD domain protein [Kazachstania unispora]